MERVSKVYLMWHCFDVANTLSSFVQMLWLATILPLYLTSAILWFSLVPLIYGVYFLPMRGLDGRSTSGLFILSGLSCLSCRVANRLRLIMPKGNTYRKRWVVVLQSKDGPTTFCMQDQKVPFLCRGK